MNNGFLVAKLSFGNPPSLDIPFLDNRGNFDSDPRLAPNEP
jgi:hypothetical protein